MRVLLISPLAGLDPPTGDVTYTETLVADPPPGVEYVTYGDALADGALVEHATRRSLAAARGARRFEEASLLARAAPVNFARRRGWLFREPSRVFSVRPGVFDLVHLHVFSAGFRRLDCPLVVSNAAPLRSLYRTGRGYSARRTAVLERIDLLAGATLGVNVNSYRLPQADRVIAFTEFLARWYTERGIDRSRIDVVPAYLPTLPAAQPRPHPHRIGYVSKAFAAKGGRTVVEAFKRLRAERPELELVVAGASPAEYGSEDVVGVTWLPYVDRSRLLGEVLPGLDVFAYPTGFDGLPITLLEAMALGLAVATSDYEAMPEIVGDAGLVSPVGDADGLARNLERLLEPGENARFRRLAKMRFETAFSTSVVAPRLVQSYRRALHAGDRRR